MQLIIAEGLTPAVLQYKSIEAFLVLSKSPNAKVIVSDGDLPVMMTEEAATVGHGALRTAGNVSKN